MGGTLIDQLRKVSASEETNLWETFTDDKVSSHSDWKGTLYFKM